MIINDLEFFNSCNQESQNNDANVIGGASVDTYVNTYVADGNSYADAEVQARGDISSATAATRAVTNKQPTYSSGYAAGYEAGYAVDGYGPFVSGQSSGISTL